MVDDVNLACLHHVFLITLVEAVSAEQLTYTVNAFAGGLEKSFGLKLGALFRLGGEIFLLVDLDKLGGQIGQHEGVRIVGAHEGAAPFTEISLLLLFVDHVVELFFQSVALLFVEVAVHLEVELIDRAAKGGHLVQAVELFILGHAKLHLVEASHGGMFVLFARALTLQHFFSLRHELVAESLLLRKQILDGGLDFVKGQRVIVLHWTRNNERRARFVDEDGVDLVNDTEVMVALNLVFLATGHPVIAQVVEAKLRGGAVGDVASIHLAARLRVHRVLDTAHSQPEKAEKVPHPLGVTTGKVVIHRDELAITARQRVEVERASRDKGLTLTSCHFRDTFFVERNATDKLNVIMDHFPW